VHSQDLTFPTLNARKNFNKKLVSTRQTASPEHEGRGTARSNPAYRLRYKTIRLDVIEGDLIAASIVELGSTRAYIAAMPAASRHSSR
jgi:hypothetical protein